MGLRDAKQKSKQKENVDFTYECVLDELCVCQSVSLVQFSRCACSNDVKRKFPSVLNHNQYLIFFQFYPKIECDSNLYDWKLEIFDFRSFRFKNNKK